MKRFAKTRTARNKRLTYPSREQEQERRQWAGGFFHCWVCKRYTPFLEIHEIASRAKAPLKWATIENYFRACGNCNSHVLNNLPESLQLAIKKFHDPSNYNRVLINRLRGRADNAISEADVNSWTDYVKAVAK